MTPSLRTLALLGLLLASGASLGAQDPALKDTFQQAKLLWATEGNRDGASAKFEQILGVLEPKARSLDPEWSQVLCETYNWLAILYDRTPSRKSQVEKLLETLVDLAPDFDVDRNVTNQRLQGLYDGIKSRKLAKVKLSFEPEGGTLVLDGKPRPTGSALRFLPVGRHTLSYSRPGYQPLEQLVEAAARDTKTLEFKLTRTSSTVTIHTCPAGVEILVDGKTVGSTKGQASAELKPMADRIGVPPEQMSEGLVLAELSSGKHRIEFRAPCYRAKVAELGEEFTTPFADHVLEPIKLEASRGQLTVDCSTPGGELFLSGRSHGLLPVKDLAVCAGSYDLQVRFPAGGFSRKVDIPEGKTISLEVRPKPRLAYLGLEGTEAFAGRDRLMEHLAALGTRLQEVSFLAPRPGESPKEALERIKASKEAELVLVARPVPDKPIHQVELSLATLTGEEEKILVKPLEQDPLGVLATRLNTQPRLWESWAGVDLLDLPGEKGPWVLQADAAAQKAGLRVGRPILQVDGRPCPDASTFRKLLKAAKGATVQVSQGESPLSLPLTRQAVELPTSSAALCYPFVLADLRLRYLGAKGDEASLLRLNQALALMHFRAFDRALELLRDARVATTQWVSQGTIDYYTGICLLHMDNAYLSEARQAFTQALNSPRATLFGPGGPLVAPLARQALEDLKP